MTLDGVPLLYNGMEVGDATESADPALFEKMPIFWNPGGRPALRSIYHDLIKLREQSAALNNAPVEWVQNTATNQVVSFLRRGEKDEFLILINFSSSPATGSLTLEDADGFEPVKIANRPPPIDTTLPDFKLDGYGWTIFQRSVSK
jgi:glycosidase